MMRLEKNDARIVDGCAKLDQRIELLLWNIGIVWHWKPWGDIYRKEDYYDLII